MDLEDLAHVTLVAGAPRSGKTEFALDMLIAAMKRYGDANAVMTVSVNCRRFRRLDRSPRCRPSHSACWRLQDLHRANHCRNC